MKKAPGERGCPELNNKDDLFSGLYIDPSSKNVTTLAT